MLREAVPNPSLLKRRSPFCFHPNKGRKSIPTGALPKVQHNSWETLFPALPVCFPGNQKRGSECCLHNFALGDPLQIGGGGCGEGND